MEHEKYYLALMVLVTCSALVGAINAKGTPKMIVSYLLSFVCLAVTAFFLTQYIVSIPGKFVSQMADEAQKIQEEKLELEKEKMLQEQAEAAAEAAARAKNEEKAEVTEYKNSIRKVMDQLEKINGFLRSANTSVASDDAFEHLRSRASALVGEVNTVKKEFGGIAPPSGVSDIHSAAQKAVDEQVQACSNFRRFFNAENAEEEHRLSQGYIYRNGQASRLISDVTSKL